MAPGLVFNVTPEDNEVDDSDKELDLRARITGHDAIPGVSGLELYAALSPGYTIVLSGTEGVPDAKGFAIGGALGATYDLSPRMFISAEVGYQRAFTSADVMLGGQSVSEDLNLSYLHIGAGAGTRF